MSDEGERNEVLAVLSSSPRDPELREYFLYIVEGILPAIVASSSVRELAVIVEQLAELFRSLSLPPRSSVQGLWCEMLLIRNASDVAAAAAAWHLGPDDLYDFRAGNQAVEVKSTSSANRVHHFSLAQLQPPAALKLVIASFVLQPCGNGLSLSELWDEVRASAGLTPALEARLFRIIAASLGVDWRRATRVRFDPNSALVHLRVYDPALVPSVDPALPSEVRDVHFSSELTSVSCVEKGELSVQGGLFQTLFSGNTDTS